MGDLASAFDAPPRPHQRGPRSGVDKILRRLDAPDADRVREVLMDAENWTDKEVAERLTANGHECSYWQVRNWRQVNGARR